jgi:hypothetical protein
MKLFKFIVRKSWQKRVVIGLGLLLLSILLLNTFHEEYPDEYDSIVGGKYISELKVPYRDWFQHHQPGAYMLAAIILPFSGISFVKFRIFLAIFYFLLFGGTYLLIKSRVKNNNLLFYIFLIFSISIASTYFWGQMLLADTLSAYLILPAYALLVMKSYYSEKFNLKDLFIVNIFAFLTWFTSMTFTYAVFGITAYAIYLYIQTAGINRKTFWQIIRPGILVVIIPYLLFFTYFLINGAIKDYYFSNVTYNQEYYIYNYPKKPGVPVNPIRYAIIIAHDFTNNYISAVAGVAGLSLFDPFVITLSFSGLALIFAVIVKGKYSLAFLILYSLIFANARSNPNSLKETDYQVYMYVLMSLFNGFFTLSVLNQFLSEEKINTPRKIMSMVVYVVLGLYVVSTNIIFFQRFFNKYYPKYMGTMPLIYDNPEIAQYVNKIVTRDDYVYIGPFSFKELFYLSTKNQPSKYHWFLDHAVKSKIKTELVADITKNRPKVVVFLRNFAPWGGDASTFNYFFTDFLDKNYFRLFELKLPDHDYRYTIDNSRNYQIDDSFYYDKNRQDEILKDLLKAGMIKDIKKI